jgi:hypothetical protein
VHVLAPASCCCLPTSIKRMQQFLLSEAHLQHCSDAMHTFPSAACCCFLPALSTLQHKLSRLGSTTCSMHTHAFLLQLHNLSMIAITDPKPKHNLSCCFKFDHSIALGLPATGGPCCPLLLQLRKAPQAKGSSGSQRAARPLQRLPDSPRGRAALQRVQPCVV